MDKLADISAFEGLSDQNGMIIQNAVGMSDLSDNIYNYIDEAAREIVNTLSYEYYRPNISAKESHARLRRNIEANREDLKDAFYSGMIAAVSNR